MQPKFTLKNDEMRAKFNQGWENNKNDPYGKRCFTYADDWAKSMEDRINAGEKLSAELMNECATKADYDGITGFMHGMGAAIVADCWVHGDEFRRIHNGETQLGNEGEAATAAGKTLNPALVRIG